MNRKTRIISSLVVVTIAIATVVGGTAAYFSDTETSTGNVLQAGAIDLKVDNESYYNGEVWPETTWELKDLEEDDLFFDFHDLKPGDWGEDTISLHITSNPAWLCVDVAFTANDDMDCTEPELEDDPTCVKGGTRFDGELADELYFVFWEDDGDNVWEEDEEILVEGFASEVLDGVSWPVADSTRSILMDNDTPLPMDPDTTYHIGKAWCFGVPNMVAKPQGTWDPTTAGNINCNGAPASNATQTDLIMGDITFRAIQARHNGDFVCEAEECEVTGSGFAVDHSFTQGTTKDSGSIPAGRSDPNKALSAPDGQFVSIGFGGSIDLMFAAAVEGNEVKVFEVTFNRDSYPQEAAKVYVSPDGSSSSWSYAGRVTNHDDSGVGTVNVSGYSGIKYVRIADDTNPSLHGGSADGFDLDAVGALICLDEVVD